MKLTKRTRISIVIALTVALLTSGIAPFTISGTFCDSIAQAAGDSQVTLHNPTYDSGVHEVTPGAVSAVGNIHNPVYDAATDTAEWDCVWFGNYWQSDTNGDGVADKNDAKEPIKWRVLSVDGDDVFLLADKNLDVKPYNTDDMDVTWETCTLRSWLNGYDSGSNACGINYTSDSFINEAFSIDEQVAIQNTNVVNKDNSEYGTEGGNDTVDKVYLLSSAEVSYAAYGFCDIFGEFSDTRISGNTAYVAGKSGYVASETGEAYDWWLRSPGAESFSGIKSNRAMYVNFASWGDTFGVNVNSNMTAIRPVLHLTLFSFRPLSYAGTTESKLGGTTTWDCVYFGNYWQSDTNCDGMADTNDEKKPIKWRVLSVDGEDVFLITDTNLDCKPYNMKYRGKTSWEQCTLRSWLNGYDSSKNADGMDYTVDNFINTAFSDAEQMAIKNTTVVNEENPYYDTDPYYDAVGGKSTTDKIYLLSIQEVSTPAYGFHDVYHAFSDTRVALNTTYTKHQGAYMVNLENGLWWLRSPGAAGYYAAAISEDGGGCDCIYADGENCGVDCAIRPVLHLDISNTDLWTYAGTVCSDATETDANGNTPTPAPTEKPEVTATPTPVPAETSKATATLTPDKTPPGRNQKKTPKPGQIIKDKTKDAFYQIVSTNTGKSEVSFVRPERKVKKSKVPSVIYHDGKKYKVTSIAEKAFAGNKKLKTVVIGKNVKSIQKKAFANCKALSKVTLQTKVLTKVAKNVFKGSGKKIVVKVPKKQKAKYQKLLNGNKKLRVK